MTDDLSWVLKEAQTLLTSHGVHGWTVKFDRARRRAGQCNHTTHTLSFSRSLMTLYPPDEIRDVIAHEVAHALAGASRHHDEVWKKAARNLGARPEARLSAALPAPEAPWIGTCPRCGARRYLYSAPRRVSSCASCSPHFDVALIWQWEHLGQPRTPPGRYQRELRSLTRRSSRR